jgi:hypothetical protein
LKLQEQEDKAPTGSFDPSAFGRQEIAECFLAVDQQCENPRNW